MTPRSTASCRRNGRRCSTMTLARLADLRLIGVRFTAAKGWFRPRGTGRGRRACSRPGPPTGRARSRAWRTVGRACRAEAASSRVPCCGCWPLSDCCGFHARRCCAHAGTMRASVGRSPGSSQRTGGCASRRRPGRRRRRRRVTVGLDRHVGRHLVRGASGDGTGQDEGDDERTCHTRHEHNLQEGSVLRVPGRGLRRCNAPCPVTCAILH